MSRRTRATLRGRWWRELLKSIAYCYRCGGKLKKAYVKAEKSRRLVCSKCGEITYVNPKVVAGLIPVMPDGRIALLRRDIEPSLGRWTYPAGFQEMGETSAAAAAREAMEEIAARVSVDSLVGIYSYADAGVVTIVYVGRVRHGEKPRPAHEAQEVGFFRPADLPWKDLAFRSTGEALVDWLRTKRRKTKKAKSKS